MSCVRVLCHFWEFTLLPVGNILYSYGKKNISASDVEQEVSLWIKLKVGRECINSHQLYKLSLVRRYNENCNTYLLKWDNFYFNFFALLYAVAATLARLQFKYIYHMKYLCHGERLQPGWQKYRAIQQSCRTPRYSLYLQCQSPGLSTAWSASLNQ